MYRDASRQPYRLQRSFHAGLERALVRLDCGCRDNGVDQRSNGRIIVNCSSNHNEWRGGCLRRIMGGRTCTASPAAAAPPPPAGITGGSTPVRLAVAIARRSSSRPASQDVQRIVPGISGIIPPIFRPAQQTEKRMEREGGWWRPSQLVLGALLQTRRRGVLDPKEAGAQYGFVLEVALCRDYSVRIKC